MKAYKFRHEERGLYSLQVLICLFILNILPCVDKDSWAVSISMTQSMCQSPAKHFIYKSLHSTFIPNTTKTYGGCSVNTY